MKKVVPAAAIAAFIALGAVAGTASTASAYVVCNGAGDCWHTDHRYHYGPGVVAGPWHRDDWYFHQDWAHDQNHRWHEWHDGRGYWGGGAWHPF